MCSIMEIYNVLSLDRHFDLPPEISWNTDIGPRKCFTTVFRSNFSTVAKASESIRRIGAIWRCQEIGSRNPLPMLGQAEQEYRNTRKIKISLVSGETRTEHRGLQWTHMTLYYPINFLGHCNVGPFWFVFVSCQEMGLSELTLSRGGRQSRNDKSWVEDVILTFILRLCLEILEH